MTLLIKNLNHQDLQITELSIKKDQSWCLYGGNNSGIDIFVLLLEKELGNFDVDLLELPSQMELLSFKGQQELFEEELRNDNSNFLGRPDPGTLVREFLPELSQQTESVKLFNMEQCLDLGYRQLSSGQSRKLLLLQKLASSPELLVIQNPYDGLDEKSCRDLDSALSSLKENGISLIILVNNRTDIPGWCTHLGLVKENSLAATGTRNEILELLPDKDTERGDKRKFPITKQQPVYQKKEELIRLKEGFANYGKRKIFAQLNLLISSGDHTLVTGPNGCGKSTLLDIIIGDNQNCYANELYIFGKRRGSGESIWELKRNMGIVSPSLHRDHRVPGSALHIVISGLYDSIGLYKKIHSSEVKKGEQWLAWLGMEGKSDVAFRQLSFAEQRLILIGRALIKGPKLLILDEPTQGLDDSNRKRLLTILEQIASQQLSTIVYVSHRRDEYRPFFTNQISLESYRI